MLLLFQVICGSQLDLILCFDPSDIFSLGFGPFRWVCSSGDSNDLAMTDEIATTVLEDFINAGGML